MDQFYDNFILGLNDQTTLLTFVYNLLFTSLLSFHLRSVYLKYGKSLSNRNEFGKNFLLIALITMIIISIVKSSLALSLGLVGALSIVRFRAAIKEPEELIYLFFAISIGLGFGANQGIIIIVAYILVMIILAIDHRYFNQDKPINNVFLTISSQKKDNNAEIDQIIQILSEQCDAINFLRYDSDPENYELSFRVEFGSVNHFMTIEKQLKDYNNLLNVRIFDNTGIY